MADEEKGCRVAGNRLASTLTVVDGGVEGVECRRQMVQTGGGKGLIVAVERIVEHGSLLLSALARSKGRRRPFLPPPCGGGALRRTGERQSVVYGQRLAVRVRYGGPRNIKKK